MSVKKRIVTAGAVAFVLVVAIVSLVACGGNGEIKYGGMAGDVNFANAANRSAHDTITISLDAKLEPNAASIVQINNDKIVIDIERQYVGDITSMKVEIKNLNISLVGVLGLANGAVPKEISAVIYLQFNKTTKELQILPHLYSANSELKAFEEGEFVDRIDYGKDEAQDREVNRYRLSSNYANNVTSVKLSDLYDDLSGGTESSGPKYDAMKRAIDYLEYMLTSASLLYDFDAIGGKSGTFKAENDARIKSLYTIGQNIIEATKDDKLGSMTMGELQDKVAGNNGTLTSFLKSKLRLGDVTATIEKDGDNYKKITTEQDINLAFRSTDVGKLLSIVYALFDVSDTAGLLAKFSLTGVPVATVDDILNKMAPNVTAGLKIESTFNYTDGALIAIPSSDDNMPYYDRTSNVFVNKAQLAAA